MMDESSDQFSDVKNGRWTADEHILFLAGLKKYRRQWKNIAEMVKTRTVVQIRTHAQKYFQKLDKLKEGKIDGKKLANLSLDIDELSRINNRSSSITSDSVGATSDEGDSDYELKNDNDTGDEQIDYPILLLTKGGSSSLPRKRAPKKKANEGNTLKKINSDDNHSFAAVHSELSLNLDPNIIFSSLPFTEEEALGDDGLICLLEDIDWTAPNVYSRSQSPFMNSAASLSSPLDASVLSVAEMWDFSSTSQDDQFSTFSSSSVAPLLEIASFPIDGIDCDHSDAISTFLKKGGQSSETDRADIATQKRGPGRPKKISNAA